MKRLCASDWIVLFAIFALGAFPPFILSITDTSSLALGLAIYLLVLSFFLIKYSAALLRPNRYFVFILLLVAFYILLQFFYHDGLNSKAYLSAPVFLLLIAVAYLSAVKLEKLHIQVLLKPLPYLVMLLFFIGFINIAFDIRFMGYVHPKAVVPFREPSHFALFSSIFFIALFVLTEKTKVRFGVVSGAFFLAAAFPNLTMLVSVFLMLLLLIKIKPIHFFFAAIGLGLVISLAKFNPYFSERLNIADLENANLSVLVYIQGVTDAYNSIVDTNGVGLGYQMLGTQPRSHISELIAKKLGSEDASLNREDGGFLAAKISSEFGLLGVVFVSMYIIIFFRSFFLLRKVIRNRSNFFDPKFILIHVVFFGFAIELFVRGYGYFSPGVFMFLVSCIFFLKRRRLITLNQQMNHRILQSQRTMF